MKKFLLFICLFASIQMFAQPDCGDNICELTETYCNCSADCECDMLTLSFITTDFFPTDDCNENVFVTGGYLYQNLGYGNPDMIYLLYGVFADTDCSGYTIPGVNITYDNGALFDVDTTAIPIPSGGFVPELALLFFEIDSATIAIGSINVTASIDDGTGTGTLCETSQSIVFADCLSIQNPTEPSCIGGSLDSSLNNQTVVCNIEVATNGDEDLSYPCDNGYVYAYSVWGDPYLTGNPTTQLSEWIISDPITSFEVSDIMYSNGNYYPQGYLPNGSYFMRGAGFCFDDYGSIVNECFAQGNIMFDWEIPIGNSNCELYKISTTPYFDTNGNDVFDEGIDPIFQGQFFENPSLDYYLYNSTGIGCFITDSAALYPISYVNTVNWQAVNPTQNAIVSPTDSLVNLYYNLIPTQIFTDIDLYITAGITRCDQQTNYWLDYCNNGTTIIDQGILSFTYSDTIEYVLSNPAPDSIANNTLYYSFTNLVPTICESIHIIFDMPGVDMLGEDINVSAGAFYGPNHDFAEYSSELICAYDPNDKLVMPNGTDTDGILDMMVDTTLTYTVRFQNTGNDTAFNVTIIDSLSSKLDLSTFKFINASHPVVLNINESNRAATFEFENILLPDSNVNETASHGYLLFTIDVNNGLPLNTNISNKAEIYFDQNPPIITNTIVSTYSVAVLPIELAALTGESYPWGNLIKWSTASEIENDYFTLEHSQDGFNFERTSIINGSGTSSNTNKYEYLDRSAEFGITYYRLSQTDFDGSSEIVGIISIRRSEEFFGITEINPIPATDIINIDFVSIVDSNIKIEVFDLAGRNIELMELPVISGKNKLSIAIDDFIEGVYFISISDGNLVSTKKFIVE